MRGSYWKWGRMACARSLGWIILRDSYFLGSMLATVLVCFPLPWKLGGVLCCHVVVVVVVLVLVVVAIFQAQVKSLSQKRASHLFTSDDQFHSGRWDFQPSRPLGVLEMVTPPAFRKIMRPEEPVKMMKTVTILSIKHQVQYWRQFRNDFFQDLIFYMEFVKVIVQCMAWMADVPCALIFPGDVDHASFRAQRSSPIFRRGGILHVM